MKQLANAYTQPDSKVLTDNDKVKIEQYKIAEDLSTTTITIMPEQEYAFTTRSGIIQAHIGSGTVSNGQQVITLDIFNRVSVERNEKITIKNTEIYPLTLTMITAN
jgi:hypothetical protein